MESKTKKCTKCGRELPVENFRTHKPTGFVLNQCKDCEREASRNRAKSNKNTGTTTVEVKGVNYTVSNSPIPGGRKLSSPNTDQVVYVAKGIGRDLARAIFVKVARVPYTGVSATVVEE